MSILPIQSHPFSKFDLPSSKDKSILIRPFTVKEEKLLLFAKETTENIIDTISIIIEQCVKYEDGNFIKVKNITTFDFEFIFIKLMSLSVNNIINTVYKDLDDLNSDGEPKEYPVAINLENLIVTKNTVSNKIKIDENTIASFMFPTMAITQKIRKKIKEEYQNVNENNLEEYVQFDLLYECLETMFVNNKLLKYEQDFYYKDVVEFIDSLNHATKEKIKEFFNDTPIVTYTAKIKKDNGEEKEIVLQGINDFFQF